MKDQGSGFNFDFEAVHIVPEFFSLLGPMQNQVGLKQGNLLAGSVRSEDLAVDGKHDGGGSFHMLNYNTRDLIRTRFWKGVRVSV